LISYFSEEKTMRDEDALIEAVLANPDDEALRLVYADWLEERGDPRADYLRTAAALATVADREERGRKLRARLDELRPGIDEGWLALMDRAPIEGCFRFRLKCPQRWEGLKRTADASVRFCEACRKKVFHCATVEHAQRHALRGHCVAIDSQVLRTPHDLLIDPTRDPQGQMMVLGMPAPPLPRYRPGQRVKVRNGPHTGLKGEVREVHLARLRVTVAVTRKGERTAVEVDFEDLETSNRPLFR
jgi:uncharacterized protein (TIGR02996 family)